MASMAREAWTEVPGRAEDALAHADALYNLARHLTRNPSDAEDLVQETYARALRGGEQLAPGANVKAWLFRILRNLFITRYRHHARGPAQEPYDTLEGGDAVCPTTRGPRSCSTWKASPRPRSPSSWAAPSGR